MTVTAEKFDKTQICSLSAEDLKDVLEMQKECGLSLWTENDYLNEIEREDSIAKVIKSENNQVIGFVVTHLLAGADDKGFSSEILNIAVRESFQKKGIGQKIFDDIAGDLREKNVSEIWLEVRESNTKAINFYRKNGFMQQYIRKNYYTDPLEDALVFKLLLDYEN